MPTTGPSYYVNAPVSGTRYDAPMWAGCIPASTANPITTVKSWTGPNGTGSLIQVTTLTAWVHDQTASTDAATFSGNFNTVTAQGSGGWGSSDWCKPSGKFSGAQSVGSLQIYLTYTGTAFVPTTPSFSPSHAAVGATVTLTGTHFTDATSVTFNGVSASFTVTNDTTISATVPAGATTGPIVVSNPAGSGTSASNFVVDSTGTVNIYAYDGTTQQQLTAVYAYDGSTWQQCSAVYAYDGSTWQQVA